MVKFFVIFALVVAYIALAAAAPTDDAVNDPSDIGTGKTRRWSGLGAKAAIIPSQALYSNYQYGSGGYYGGLGIPAYSQGLGYNSLAYSSAYPGIGQLGYGYPGYAVQGVGVGAVPVGVGYVLH